MQSGTKASVVTLADQRRTLGGEYTRLNIVW